VSVDELDQYLGNSPISPHIPSSWQQVNYHPQSTRSQSLVSSVEPEDLELINTPSIQPSKSKSRGEAGSLVSRHSSG
jgi:hypothetical protein